MLSDTDDRTSLGLRFCHGVLVRCLSLATVSSLDSPVVMSSSLLSGVGVSYSRCNSRVGAAYSVEMSLSPSVLGVLFFLFLSSLPYLRTMGDSEVMLCVCVVFV